MTRSILKSVALAVFLAAGAAPALAQGTAFTYQGQLTSDGLPVDSSADFEFRLFSTATGGSQLGSSVVRTAVSVTSGLFTTPVDFGVNQYTSNQALFLEIAVRNPAGSGSFVTLGSRQPLTPAPFSLATRGINVDAAGDVALLTGTDRRISVPTAPFNANGTNLAISAGNAATFGNAVDGGDLVLEAGRAFNATQSFVRPGDVFIRSGGNSISTNSAPNGGDIIMQTGGAFNAVTERMRVTQSGNVGIGIANPSAPLHVLSSTGGALRNTAVFSDGGFSTFRIAHPSSQVVALGGLNDHTLQIGGLGTSAFNPIMTITPFNSGGNVGIGTTTPANRLSVSGNADITGNVGIGTTTPQLPLHVRAPQVTTAAVLQVDTCGAPCGGPNYTEALRVINIAVAGGLPNGAGQVGIGMATAAAATATSTADAWIGTGFPSDPGNGSNDFIIATKTSPTALTNRVRVNGDNGNVGIGTDAPAARLHNVGTTRLDSTLQFGAPLQNGNTLSWSRFDGVAGATAAVLDISPATVANGSAFIINRNGSGVFLFQLDGVAAKIGGGAWSVLSDERSKTDIQPMTGTLDRLLQLKGHSYTYKPEFVENGRALPGVQVGLVAQEVEAIFPDWVTTGSDGLKQVTERSTTALMVEALRDLRTEKDREIESLKARLERLEAILTAQSK